MTPQTDLTDMCVVTEASQGRDYSKTFYAEVPKVCTRANQACVAEGSRVSTGTSGSRGGGGERSKKLWGARQAVGTQGLSL